MPRQIVQGDRSEGASGFPDASISEGERTRCRVAPTALVCATASMESGSLGNAAAPATQRKPGRASAATWTVSDRVCADEPV
jgi:hypothetical protein